MRDGSLNADEWKECKMGDDTYNFSDVDTNPKDGQVSKEEMREYHMNYGQPEDLLLL